MKKILVPIDFTAASRNAADYAAPLARSFQTEVHLLHVYMEPLPVGNVPDYRAVIADDVHTENANLVNKEITRLREKYGLPVTGSLAVGFKGNSINAKADEIGAGLVVMGMKASAKKRFPGSTVTRMIRKSKQPLLIVPEEAPFQPIQNIVLAIDFSEMITTAGLTVLFEMIKQFNAALRVLHVIPRGADLKASEVAARLQIGRVLSSVNYSYDPVEYDDVDAGILQYTNSHPTDLLVMIAHKHSIFQRLFNPVHTSAISFTIRMPLLIVKSQVLFS